jgi:hypothetical protein
MIEPDERGKDLQRAVLVVWDEMNAPWICVERRCDDTGAVEIGEGQPRRLRIESSLILQPGPAALADERQASSQYYRAIHKDQTTDIALDAPRRPRKAERQRVPNRRCVVSRPVRASSCAPRH